MHPSNFFAVLNRIANVLRLEEYKKTRYVLEADEKSECVDLKTDREGGHRYFQARNSRLRQIRERKLQLGLPH